MYNQTAAAQHREEVLISLTENESHYLIIVISAVCYHCDV